MHSWRKSWTKQFLLTPKLKRISIIYLLIAFQLSVKIDTLREMNSTD